MLTAIRDASFDVNTGEIVGVVGESGCGKSTVASAVMRLLPPNGEISGGQILFQGQDLRQLDQEAMRQLRGKEMAMIFQDPMTSLNPVFSIEQQMIDALRAHQVAGKRQDRTSAAGARRGDAGPGRHPRRRARRSRNIRTSSPAGCASGS